MRSVDRLPPGEVHLHLVADATITSPDLLDAYQRLLTPEELARGQRFHFEKHRHQFLVTRALLRTTLSRYRPDIGPADWRFTTNAYGRPSIVGEAGQGLDFNLSHTEGRVVLALAPTPQVGVDIEWPQRPGETVELADRFFAVAESAALRALPAPQQRQRFFDLWTLKEAYIKARGAGLSIPLAGFAFDFPSDRGLSISFRPECPDDASQWRFWTFDIGPEYAMSLALGESLQCRPRLFSSVPLAATHEVECRVLRHS